MGQKVHALSHDEWGSSRRGVALDQLRLVDSPWSISLTLTSRARRRPAGSSAPPTPKASSPRFENQNDKLSTYLQSNLITIPYWRPWGRG